MGLTAVAEVVSLGSVIPFLTVLADPNAILKIDTVQNLLQWLNISTDQQSLRLTFTIIFSITALVAGLMRFSLIYCSSKVNFGTAHELGKEVFRRTLLQSYSLHISRNSSEIIAGLGKVSIVAWAIAFGINSLSATIMAAAILSILIYSDPFVSLVVLGWIGLVYGTVSIITRKKLQNNSKTINASSNQKVQTIQEALGSFRDIVLDQSEQLFYEKFRIADKQMRDAEATNAIIGPSPRFGVEAMGMVLIAGVAFFLTQRDGSLATAIPVLGVLVLGAQRLMPLIQQIYRGFVYYLANRASIDDVCRLLKLPIDEERTANHTPMPFREFIRLEEISFEYHETGPRVLNRVSLEIPKGSKVGFVGETGSGKSTLLDLIMGLLNPTKGTFSIDGVKLDAGNMLDWQKNISHVPQTIFLSDTTFAENIAFGVAKSEIDLERVKFSAKQAMIASFIESSKNGYWGNVGERGIRLSGGQRQRIGIARALYKNAPVLVLDEATSALDSKTEKAVVESILSNCPGVTILMIAHRTSTLDDCDFVVALNAGSITEIRLADGAQSD